MRASQTIVRAPAPRVVSLFLTLVAIATIVDKSLSAEPASGFRLPAGFTITEVAGSGLANDIHTMTVGPGDHVTVAGRGYIRILVDDHRDGTFDRAEPFTDFPADGAMGLFWEGTTLFAVGDGGVWEINDHNGDFRPDAAPIKRYRIITGGEHAAHAVARGPDGWLYLLVGNNSGTSAKNATSPSSPIRVPVAGCLLRISPDFATSEIVADGFRNPYAFDWNAAGEIFTYDSDNERCVSLPWQEGTRVYHVVPGGHHGWEAPERMGLWRMPPYFIDGTPPLADLGRGSPTGVCCYRHAQFSEKYRDGLFVADWTFGRVWFLKLTPRGSTYEATPEVFAESTGDNGFAPTALVVDRRTGDLLISIGGRGARGAIYRVRYANGKAVPERWTTPKPLSRDVGKDEILKGAASNDLFIRRRAIEQALRNPGAFTSAEQIRIALSGAERDDRPCQRAAARLLNTLSVEERKKLAHDARSADLVTIGLAVAEIDPPSGQSIAKRLWAEARKDEDRLAALRILMIALGDLGERSLKGSVWEGYSRRRVVSFDASTLVAFREAFPTGRPLVDRELGRLFAMVEDADAALPGKFAAKLSPDADPVDEIHYLICLGRSPAPRDAGVTHRAADAILSLDAKLEKLKRNRDRNWYPRVAELYAGLAKRDHAFNAAVLANPSFGRPDHVIFARSGGLDRRQAAARFLKVAKKDADFGWTGELVDLVATGAPAEATPVLRSLAARPALHDSVIRALAREPQDTDRERFHSGLSAANLETVSASAKALERLGPRRDEKEAIALVEGLLRAPVEPETAPVRGRLVKLLEASTGESGFGDDRDRWLAWAQAKYPSAKFTAGVDRTAWTKRFASIDWRSGDGAKGEHVFARASCTACHNGARAMGPDLAGAARRFSRDDLLTAIVDPQRDVSERYRNTLVALDSGEVYQGMVVYEAVDSLILQTAADQTRRIPVASIAHRRGLRSSLMPTGLLDRLTDAEIADLVAYLHTIGQPRAVGSR